jgi:cytochrome c-type biogenesis protein CcmE
VSPARKRQLIAVSALVVAGSALGFIAFGGIEKNLVYYWDVAQILEKGAAAVGPTVRLGGLVQQGTLDWNASTLDLHFQVGMKPEPGGPTVAVASRGAPPQMFREGIGVVLEGQYDGKVFHADRVMVKHSNEYRAPKEGERPEDLYGTLIEETKP